ncbi:MAG: hypothetical protein WC840_04275 [Candidatus Peribacteraceae bacterium]
MVLLLDWVTTVTCFIATLVLGYAVVATSKKWLRILLTLGVLFFFGLLIFGIGVLWSDYRTFR